MCGCTFMHDLTRVLYHKYFTYEDELFSILPSDHVTNDTLFIDIMNAFYNSQARRVEMRDKLTTYKRTTRDICKKFRVKLYHMLMRNYIIFDIRCIIISYLI